MSLRVRFAPSPSGHLHVGNARTALFNWLFARRHSGTFVLRIEDTDSERSTRESEAAILDDLRWLGLTWDEGPDTGGPSSPYRQSERSGRYAEAARRLLSRGAAYRCFCTVAQLEAERAAALAAGQPPKYSGRCRVLDETDAAQRAAAGEPAALRFAVTPGPDVAFDDIVRGPVSFSRDVIGDPVIVRSDGRPAYNFAVVVDDIEMAISHVVRGEDHISNTPRQLLIYEALGARPPAFAHLSLVLGPDHAPLSKRHGATSVAEFRAKGFLAESLVNYLALLGWSPGADEEIVPVTEMVRRFELEAVSHSAAVFDVTKLSWMNRHYMKERPLDRLAPEAAPYFVQAGYLTRETSEALALVAHLLPLAVGSVDRLDEIPTRLSFIFDWNAGVAAELARQESGAGDIAEALALELTREPALDRELFRAVAGRLRERTGLKGRALFHTIRVIVTGAESGPELDLAVPAIERGARVGPDAGVRAIRSCAERARLVASALGRP